ncbi:hypothetical protein BGZ68_001271 [Mortierella alpina]|nr:hypothetical protein BGZ68_001271 [Mortierella alpina]
MEAVFGIPEIQDRIGHFLYPYSVANCLRVSKHFQSWFLPVFWHAVRIGRSHHSSLPDEHHLKTYSSSIRQLSLHGFVPQSNVFESTQHLSYISLSGKLGLLKESDSTWALYTTLILQSRATLRTIRLSNLEPAPSEGFWKALTSDAHTPPIRLKRLQLEDLSFDTSTIAQLFWRVCERIEALEMENVSFPWQDDHDEDWGWFGMGLVHQDPSEKAVAVDSTLSSSPSPRFAKLKELRIQGETPHMKPEDLLMTLIAQAPELRHLSWILGKGDAFPAIAFLRLAGKDQTWRNLETLQLQSPKTGSITDSCIAAVLSSLMVNSRAAGQRVGQNECQGLRELRVSRSGFGNESMAVLARAHGGALMRSIEVLDVQSCEGVPSLMVQQLLESCPSLRTLRATALSIQDIVQGEPWACSGLREMEVQLYEEADQDGAEEQKQCNYANVRARLRKLVLLNKCYLGIPSLLDGSSSSTSHRTFQPVEAESATKIDKKVYPKHTKPADRGYAPCAIGTDGRA